MKSCSRKPPCGKPHPRCSGHVKSTGQPCMRWPIAGGVACDSHGGATEKAREKAAERVADAQAEALVARLLDNPDAEPITDPVAALQRLAGRLTYAVDYLGQLANDNGQAIPAWERVIAQLRQLLVSMAQLGIEERVLRLEETKVRWMVAVINAVLDDLDLSPDQRALVPVVVPARVRALEIEER